MEITVKDFVNTIERSIKYWENGTLKYDNSIPKEYVDALYRYQVEINKNALEYLYTLDENLVIQTDIGAAKEGSK